MKLLLFTALAIVFCFFSWLICRRKPKNEGNPANENYTHPTFVFDHEPSTREKLDAGMIVTGEEFSYMVREEMLEKKVKETIDQEAQNLLHQSEHKVQD